MAKREREKKEKDKTKVEFVSGVVKKPPRPADQLSILPGKIRLIYNRLSHKNL